MTQQATITVQSQKFGSFENKATGATLWKWNVTDEEGNTYSKLVKEDFESPVQDGDTVDIKFTTNGKFKNLVELPEATSKSTKATSATRTAAVRTTKVTKPLDTTTKSFTQTDSSKGMRDGMITKAAVDLAVARQETTLEDLQQAALDVIELTKFVSSQDTK